MYPPFSLIEFLQRSLLQASRQLANLGEGFDPQLRPADPRFGDFQANGLLAVAKQKDMPAQELAQQFREILMAQPEWPDIQVGVTGPGFLTFRLGHRLIEDWLEHYGEGERFAQSAAVRLKGHRIVVDYSSPNIAKQMHVGHIRSTVLGEAIARLFRFFGADVVADNHIGDWGTQFGILMLAIKEKGFDLNAPHPDPLEALEELYREGSARFKEDPAFQDRARQALLALQQGEAQARALWEAIGRLSYQAFEEVYRLLGVRFDCVLGESFYQNQLQPIYQTLTDLGIAVEDQGALVVFHPEHPRFSQTPFIIRKTDGASNYASTDLATVLYRTQHFKASEVVYVTDSRQQDHFEQLFLTCEKWAQKGGFQFPRLRHITLGTILGEDGKAIKTRTGTPVRLKSLLQEAMDRAYAVVSEKSPEKPESLRRHIAQVIGIGAVRYADLMQNRNSDYVFSWNKLLSFEGNTAPYLLYAIARIHSILGKVPASQTPPNGLETELEWALGRKLLGFITALEMALVELRPHFLCQYLYELAGTFSTFYQGEKVNVEDAAVRARRLKLCRITLHYLETGLHLLGLETLQEM